ncbi:MAG: hypothetical protein ACK40R_06415, partial [Thermomonas sp.]
HALRAAADVQTHLLVTPAAVLNLKQELDLARGDVEALADVVHNVRDVGAAIGPRAQLGLVGWREQQLLMADRPAADFGFKRPPAAQFADGVRWQQAAPAARWLLVEQGDGLPACVDRAQARDMGLANGRRWWLLDARASAACHTSTPPSNPIPPEPQ